MKKLFAGILLSVFIIGTTTISVGATEQERSFIDANGDGICDNWKQGNIEKRKNYVDQDGDGVCDNYGKRIGAGHGRRCRRGNR